VIFQPLDCSLSKLISSKGPDATFQYYELPVIIDILHDIRNPLTASKNDLGKKLFFETGFADKTVKAEYLGTYYCATCLLPLATCLLLIKQIEGIWVE
jgi:hypothetical protein|tara:strand:+ start:744 stop:1037 length:294 start_codon:yes stop_codon:yes gene_type:complete